MKTDGSACMGRPIDLGTSIMLNVVCTCRNDYHWESGFEILQNRRAVQHLISSEAVFWRIHWNYRTFSLNVNLKHLGLSVSMHRLFATVCLVVA